MASSVPQLKPLRVPEARKQTHEAENSGAAASSPPTPPAAAGAGGAALLSAQPSSDLLPCGLFEDELHELDELLQSHSPKNASPIAATQLK
ncbi:hypothetical protein COHA_000370 [Chlorella ohadii]|uniref:Uncharacterized protein n=1 Tax=Chlorella ohadii TaxID=2649997 RepID=A0AAD5H6G1_9CHLO|nr:hypothetical protein COHA_000370 [Chlorella ohadii]